MRDSATDEPIRGVVLTLSDSTGKFLGRSIADTAGRFAVSRFVGAARLNATRIGFRPRTLALPRDPNDSVITVRMQAFVSLMDAVSSTTTRVCPGDQPAAGGLDLWEQARAGLLATIVSREQHPPNVRVFSYAVRRNPVTRRISWDSTKVRDVVVERSFVAARPAWAFAAEGYMREMTGGDRTYYAPDEDTLLDPSFAETHCLRVVRDDKSHAGEIGIGFEPVRGDSRDTLVDINGVLWLDRASPRIQSLEYTYTGLEPDARGAGGELYFFTTPGGVAMVDHWKIHAPVLAYDAPSIADVVRRSPPPRPERRDVRVLAYTEMGGEVISARWPDGVLWHGSHPRIVGTINDQHGAPMPGQQVWITGSADTVTSRLDGRFEFPYMMRGVYLVQASDSGLARHGMTRTPPVAVRLDGPTDRVVNLVEYARDDVLALACPAKSYRPGTGVLLGVVINADSEPVAGAHIEVLEQPTADSLRATPRYVEGAGDGTFAVCGASLKWPMRVRAEKDGMTAEANVADWSDDVVELTLVLRRKDD